jgi:bifunctional polynucleotide phosphatase/kinase
MKKWKIAIHRMLFPNLHKRRVLFMDLDDTLIVTISGKTFPVDEYDWEFKPGILDSIVNYRPTWIHIVTNQGGIAAGYIDEEKFLQKMGNILFQLKKDTWTEDSFEMCTSLDRTDKFRKPNPGMVNRFITMHNLASDECLMVGDASGKFGDFSDSDKECARRAGIKYMDVDDFIVKYGKKN